MNNKLFFTLVIFGTILMVALLFFQNQSVWAEELVEEGTSGTGVYQAAIDQLKSMINPTNSETAQTNLDSKIQAMEYKQNVQATAMTEPQKSLEQVCKAIQAQDQMTKAYDQEEKPQGIITVSADFLGEEGYLINTAWEGVFMGYDTEIYAGSLYDDLNKGILILRIPALNLLKVFSDPQPEGALTIALMQDNRIQLTTANGNAREFDLPAQQFMNDLSKSLAVVDLPVAPTPIPDPCAAYTSP